MYTGDTDATGSEILNKMRERFNIVLPKSIDFIFLHQRLWVEAGLYSLSFTRYYSLVDKQFKIYLFKHAFLTFYISKTSSETEKHKKENKILPHTFDQ